MTALIAVLYSTVADIRLSRKIDINNPIELLIKVISLNPIYA